MVRDQLWVEARLVSCWARSACWARNTCWAMVESAGGRDCGEPHNDPSNAGHLCCVLQNNSGVKKYHGVLHFTVLAVSNSVKHDMTLNTVLKRVEVKIWCGMCRFVPWAQRWVQRFKVKAAHLDVRVLKRKSPGEEGLPNRTEIWLCEGVQMDEMYWNFHETIPAPRPTISSWIHSPAPPPSLAPWASMQNPRVTLQCCV